MLNMAGDAEGAVRAHAAFTEYVAPLVEERRARPGDDLLSTIVTEEVEGERLADDEVFGFLRLLFPAGVDTTWLTLGSLMAAVLEHPELHARLLADEEERYWAIEETLRWESTTGTEARSTTEDVVVSGVEDPRRRAGPAGRSRGQPRPRRVPGSGSMGHRPAPEASPRVRDRPPLLPRSVPRPRRAPRGSRGAAATAAEAPVGRRASDHAAWCCAVRDRSASSGTPPRRGPEAACGSASGAGSAGSRRRAPERAD